MQLEKSRTVTPLTSRVVVVISERPGVHDGGHQWATDPCHDDGGAHRASNDTPPPPAARASAPFLSLPIDGAATATDRSCTYAARHGQSRTQHVVASACRGGSIPLPAASLPRAPRSADVVAAHAAESSLKPLLLLPPRPPPPPAHQRRPSSTRHRCCLRRCCWRYRRLSRGGRPKSSRLWSNSSVVE